MRITRGLPQYHAQINQSKIAQKQIILGGERDGEKIASGLRKHDGVGRDAHTRQGKKLKRRKNVKKASA